MPDGYGLGAVRLKWILSPAVAESGHSLYASVHRGLEAARGLKHLHLCAVSDGGKGILSSLPYNIYLYLVAINHINGVLHFNLN